MALQLMLLEERREQSQWLVNALISPATFEVPISRPHQAKFYFSIIESLERMDGSRGNFRRQFAYTAMKIFDIHISSYSAELLLRAQADRQIYKSLALGCLFIALQMSTHCPSENSLAVDGESMPLRTFLDTCSATDDVPAFATLLERIRASLRPFLCFRREASPLVSTQFYDVLKDHLIEHFPRVVQDNQALLDNAEKLMELTLANLWFASYAPSLNAVASFVVAVQDVEREVVEGLLDFYSQSGGYDLTCLQALILHLTMQQQPQVRQIPLQAQAQVQLNLSGGLVIQHQHQHQYQQQQMPLAAIQNLLASSSPASSLSSQSNTNRNAILEALSSLLRLPPTSHNQQQ